MLSRLLPTVFPRLIASAAKTPSLRLTHSQVFKAWRMVGQSSGRNPNGSGKDWELEGTKSDEETISEKEDSCTIFLGRRRICFELLPPVRPEMIAVRRLDRGEEDDNGELPLDLAKQVINLVHESTSEWLPHLSFTAGVLCPHCHHSGSPHVIDVSELSEVVVCRRSHEPVTLEKASWAFHWRQETLDGEDRLVEDTELPIIDPGSPPRRSLSVEDPPAELQALQTPETRQEAPESAREHRPSLPGVEKRTVPIPTLEASASMQSLGKEKACVGLSPFEHLPLRDSFGSRTEYDASDPAISVNGRIHDLYVEHFEGAMRVMEQNHQVLQRLVHEHRGQWEALCEQEYRAELSAVLSSKVEIDVRLGLSSTLLELLAHGDRAYPGAPVFLHCAMHAGYAASTHGLEPFLLLEDEVGGPQPLPRWRLLQWLRQREGQKCPLSGVFLNCCDSEGIAGAFMEAGVPHVICCRGRVFDGACKTFTKAFYRSLAAGRQVFSAFEFAQESVAFSPQAGLRPEAQKFVLLPRQEDVLKYPGLSVAPMARHYSATLQLLTGHAIDESKELGNTSKAMKVEMARHLSRSDRARVVNVWGKAPGLGKTAMLAEFTRFCIYPGRLFEGLAIWVPLRFAPPEPTPGLLPLVRASSGPRSERGDLFLEQVQSSFGGLKTDNLELKPLQPKDAAQLFLYRVHRHLYWKARSFQSRKICSSSCSLQDIWRSKEEWMKKATEWYGDNIYKKVADRSLLDTGDVPITLEREKREEVLNALAAMPLLSEFCQGIPLRIQQTAERVTSSLPSLWVLLAELRDARARNRQEIQQRLLAPSTLHAKRRSISGAWQLGKVIGQGAQGVVYKALDSVSGESFAVKVLEDSKELHQELELLQFGVSYLGHEVHDRQLYIFLEYMPEGTLKDKIDEFGAFQEEMSHIHIVPISLL
ncbi:unnamed protein product [Durusdinium trenchii]|uniref:Protein kinase domain-containing protein n=1 Tax=Durusdinium trenchii TaxID=1381693 RepID=A0ABP0QDB2_9DINO